MHLKVRNKLLKTNRRKVDIINLLGSDLKTSWQSKESLQRALKLVLLYLCNKLSILHLSDRL